MFRKHVALERRGDKTKVIVHYRDFYGKHEESALCETKAEIGSFVADTLAKAVLQPTLV